MSVYDVAGSLLHIAYDVQGNSLNAAYKIDGVPIPFTSFNDETTVTDVFSSTISKYVQGGCIDDDGYIYLCLYYQCFLKIDVENGTYTQYPFASGAYGHGNGMCYNPNTDIICVAPMLNTGEVYALDRSLNLLNTYTAKNANGQAFNCWNIAYDRINNRYVVLNGNTIHYFDDNFDLIETEEYVQNDWVATRQDIETDGEFIYCISFSSPNKITVFDMNGNLIKVILNSAFVGECESMMYDWINNKFYMNGRTSDELIVREVHFKN